MPRATFGLTGGIASGKSAAANEFASLGAVIVDTDLISREVVEPGSQGLAQISREFGPGVIADDGQLNRAKLGEIVFGEPDQLAALNAIVHPLVRERAAQLTAAAPAGAIVIQVIPLLVETHAQERLDGVVVVDVPEQVQLARLVERDGLSTAAATQRIKAQASRQARLGAADWVIENSGSMQSLVDQVFNIWQELLKVAEVSSNQSGT